LSVTSRLRSTEQNGNTSTSNQRRAINHESPFWRDKFLTSPQQIKIKKVKCFRLSLQSP